MEYETIVGLEVHVELATRSKIFCGCTTEFGGSPNTQVCPVCSGLPGSLPVLNKSVVEYAIRTGLALGCEINTYNKFDRKNYFYPDLPKAYQISQLYMPICRNGWLEIQDGGVTQKIGIHEIHMEEDAGKLIHDPIEDCTLVDYNRCGVPLLEIVSEPDLRSADQVISYLKSLREILVYLDVSNCKMQEGSMRADVNLSVRPKGQSEFGTRIEMKNMNSFKAIHRAVISESKRQIDLLEDGRRIIQQTRRWDTDKDSASVMRSKENAQDYRYFPDPDLLPVEISRHWIDSIRNNMPELPQQKRMRYMQDYGLSDYDAGEITSTKEISTLFEQTVSLCGHPKQTANMIMGEVMRLLSDNSILPEHLNLDYRKLAVLVNLIVDGKINRSVGRQVLNQIYLNDVDPLEYVQQHRLIMLSDDTLIADTVKAVLADNTKSVEDYKNGKQKAFGFLVGQTMKALKGKADPQTVNKLLKQKLEKM